MTENNSIFDAPRFIDAQGRESDLRLHFFHPDAAKWAGTFQAETGVLCRAGGNKPEIPRTEGCHFPVRQRGRAAHDKSFKCGWLELSPTFRSSPDYLRNGRC